MSTLKVGDFKTFIQAHTASNGKAGWSERGPVIYGWEMEQTGKDGGFGSFSSKHGELIKEI